MPAIPRREDDLARPRSRKGNTQPKVTKGQARPVTIPPPGEGWDDAVRAVWNSMASSGQADFYQDSDFAYARIVLDDLNRLRAMGRPPAEAMRAMYAALDRLLLTEGERRRAHIELAEPAPETSSAAESAIVEYRRELGLTG